MSGLYEMLRQNAPDGPLLHIVSFKFLETTSLLEQASLMDECSKLAEHCGGVQAGIVGISTAKNIDSRKGFTWVESAVFTDVEAFIAFHAHPVHQEFAQKMAQTADVWIVTNVPLPTFLHT